MLDKLFLTVQWNYSIFCLFSCGAPLAGNRDKDVGVLDKMTTTKHHALGLKVRRLLQTEQTASPISSHHGPREMESPNKFRSCSLMMISSVEPTRAPSFVSIESETGMLFQTI